MYSILRSPYETQIHPYGLAWIHMWKSADGAETSRRKEHWSALPVKPAGERKKEQ
tara:strand:+ start:18328 stop:18492 length:165 start_codon:yes stop_codon:yes gene_type:complete